MILSGNSQWDSFYIYILGTFQFSDSRWNIIVKNFRKIDNEMHSRKITRWPLHRQEKKKELEILFRTKTCTQGTGRCGDVKRGNVNPLLVWILKYCLSQG